MTTEASTRTDFSQIRYAQVWEDADLLLEALNPRPGMNLLSIASAGDNALALLSGAPERVIALDINPAQIACLELRVAAYRELKYTELLELIGSRPSTQRATLYQRCRPLLNVSAASFWDAHPKYIERGIGGTGKLERYFQLFRNRVLPLIHSKQRVRKLLAGGDLLKRRHFYSTQWDTWRWRLLFHIFFSRFVLGQLGRDPGFFKYVEGSVASRLLLRTEHAFTELDPADNPYLHWILTGTHGQSLPFALREENFEKIRANLDQFEWHLLSVESFLEQHPGCQLDGCNLSDIFEYMSEENMSALLERLVSHCRQGGRLAYWNMLAPRSRPDSLAGCLRPLDVLSESLFLKDKAFFYSRFVLEEVS